MEKIIKQKQRGSLIVISGPSGSGKYYDESSSNDEINECKK